MTTIMELPLVLDITKGKRHVDRARQIFKNVQEISNIQACLILSLSCGKSLSTMKSSQIMSNADFIKTHRVVKNVIQVYWIKK